MNLLHANLNRLDVARRDLRDLKGLGPWAVASERRECLDLRAVNSLDNKIQTDARRYVDLRFA